MTPQDPNDVPAPLDPDNPEAAMRDARQRFLAAFPKRSDSIGLMLATVATVGSRGPVGPLRQMVHRMAGLAGMLGFPRVSIRARDLELLVDGLDDGAFDPDRASQAFDALEQAFTEDLTHPPRWVGLDPSAGGDRRVLVVEDDEDQREVICINLRASGFLPIPVQSGDLALSLARDQPPDLIVLDAMLPGLDGYTVCRLLRSDPALASTPILFLTVRGGLDDRLVGLALGADEYLVKPVNMQELVVRIQLLLARIGSTRPPASPVPAGGSQPRG